jgi:hypothetical protein
VGYSSSSTCMMSLLSAITRPCRMCVVLCCGIEMDCFCVVLIISCSCLGFIRVVFDLFCIVHTHLSFILICFDLYSSKVKERNRS